MKELHITVREDVAERLDTLSRNLDTSRAALVREAVEEYVSRRERELVAAEMSRYATEMSPASGEFVDQTWPAVSQLLLETTEW